MKNIFENKNKKINILEFKLECTERAYKEQCEINKMLTECNWVLLQSVQTVCNMNQLQKIEELHKDFVKGKQVEFLNKCLTL